jgi:hypothetical protein
MLNGDLADSSLASHDDDRAALYADLHEDETTEQMLERLEREAYHDAGKVLLGLLKYVLHFCRTGGDAVQCLHKVEIASWMFGNADTSNWSMARLAKEYKMTRASFNNTLLELQAGMDLPPGIAQKIIESRRAYATARNEKCK